jgi:glycerol-3-phosphate acyltransferase PlsY
MLMGPYLAIAVIAYLLGSIPFGLLLVRLVKGEDVRLTGSGNIGATNVARSGGAKLGVITLLLDGLKGYLAVLFALLLAHRLPELDASLAAAIAALATIIGHVFPVWLHFRGGKGVATAVGAFLAMAPRAVLVVLAIFLLIVLIFRYVSLGSVVASAAFPILAFFIYRGSSSVVDLAVMLTASLLIIFKHKSNIQRLINGTENRLHFGKS